jgi:lysozyme
MARRPARSRRTGPSRWQWRVLGAVVLLALVGGAWAWWDMRHWSPSRSIWPRQGALVGEVDGLVDFTALKAIGADFVYVEASASAASRDPSVVRNLDAARAAGLKVGALHKYDPCQPADKQAANFVTVVPRDARMLSPAVELEQVADHCLVKVSDAAVVSELMTFINQIETHTGKPAILKLGAGFEAQYHIAGALDRGLWLSRDRFEPDYGGRPWALWSANSALETSASATPLRWVVVQK